MINVKETKRKKAVGYIRVSTMMQKEEGHSLQSQVQQIEDFTKRHNYELTEIYSDEGISGKNVKNRPGIQKLIDDAKQDKFDLVVIWKLTRLGRSMKDVLNIAELLNANNVGLHSVSEAFDITTSTGKMMLGLLANFAEFERAQISENVKMSMLTLVEKNRGFPGGRMIGYRSIRDDTGRKILVIEPKEAKVVKLIFQKYLGGDGYRAIANSLNKMGYRTIKGNPFSITAVKDILYNPTYSGKIRYNRHVDWELKRRKGYNPNYILVDGPHEPIIDKEFFQKVQDRLKLESKQPKWNHRGENLLTGLLKCPECEAAMSASNTTNTLKDGTKKRIRYYSCGKFRQQGSSVCHANSIRADKAEPFVLERLSEVIQVPEILSNVVSELNKQIQTQRKPWERELQQLGADLVETQKKLEKWEDLIKVSPELRVDLNDRIQQLEMECVNNRKRTQELVQILHTEGYSIKLSDAKKVMGLVTQLLEDSDSKAAKKAILRTFVDKITVDKDSKSNYKIYMKFDDVVIAKLNEQMKKEPTAGYAVGSLFLPQVMRLNI